MSASQGCRLRGVGCRNFLLCKKGGIDLQKAIVHLVIVGLLFFTFFSVQDTKVGSRGVKQQIVEKELVLLIEASEAGSSFEVWKKNPSGIIDNVDVRDGRVYVSVDGLRSIKGYPYFSRYDVDVKEVDSKFVVKVS